MAYRRRRRGYRSRFRMRSRRGYRGRRSSVRRFRRVGQRF